MRVADLHIIEDEGTRVLVGGTEEGTDRKVSFHVVLTSERGIELVERLREDPDSVQVDIPAPKGVEHGWTEKIEGNLPTDKQCEECGRNLFTDEVEDKRCREHRNG